MKKTHQLLASALIVASMALTACGGDDSAPGASAADGVTEVTRQLLAEARPDTAQGQLLELTRVIIPSKQSIAPHIHPGPQLAVIETGTLTYMVIEGEVTVIRAAATARETVETYGAGQTARLQPGDSLIETPGMVHRAENETDGPVIIYLSSLFPEGAAPSSPAP